MNCITCGREIEDLESAGLASVNPDSYVCEPCLIEENKAEEEAEERRYAWSVANTAQRKVLSRLWAQADANKF